MTDRLQKGGIMIGSMQLGSIMMNYAKYTEQKTSARGQVNSFSGVYESKSAASVDAARTEEVAGTEKVSVESMLKAKYPGAFYNVMDTSKIDHGLWGRNDYPWDAYFTEPANDAVLNWTPSGPEPSMQHPSVASKINSMAGKLSIVIPPELEEKMQNDDKLAQQVMGRVDEFIAKYYRPEANQGFLITFKENGEIGEACIACEGRVTVSSSEFVEARRAREKRTAEYERIAEENAIKRKLLEQDRLEKDYRIASMQNAILEYSGGLMDSNIISNHKM